jgi:predicted NBD/HSP70 family sugar kinase
MARGTSLEHTRELNRRAVLTALSRSATSSRREIAQRTGLSLSAVNNLVDDLVRDGWVVQRGRRATPRGQPPRDFTLARDGAFGVGVSIDRDHAAAALVDLGGAVLAERREPWRESGLPDAAALVASLAHDLTTTLSPRDRRRLLGVGVALPGVIARDGVVQRLIDFPSWTGSNVVEALRAAGVYRAIVVKDAVAAAVGAASHGPARALDACVYVLFSFGLGSSVLLEGRPYRGLWWDSGRVGHLQVDPSGGVCDVCGARGCLRLSCSVTALLERAGDAGASGASVDAQLEALAARASAADPAVHACLERAAVDLARALVSVELLLDPEAVVFDGRLPPSLLRALVRRAETHYTALRPPAAMKPSMRLLVDDRWRLAVAFGAAVVPMYAATAPDLELIR